MLESPANRGEYGECDRRTDGIAASSTSMRHSPSIRSGVAGSIPPLVSWRYLYFARERQERSRACILLTDYVLWYIGSGMTSGSWLTWPAHIAGVATSW